MRAIHFAVAVLALFALACGSKERAQVRTGGIAPQFSRVDTTVTQEDSTSARFYIYVPGNLRDPFVKPGVKRRQGSGEVDAGPPPLKVEIILYDQSICTEFIVLFGAGDGGENIK